MNRDLRYRKVGLVAGFNRSTVAYLMLVRRLVLVLDAASKIGVSVVETMIEKVDAFGSGYLY